MKNNFKLMLRIRNINMSYNVVKSLIRQLATALELFMRLINV